jgi:hypothetical protein
MSASCPVSAPNPGARLSRRSGVVVEQSTETLASTHATDTPVRRRTVNHRPGVHSSRITSASSHFISQVVLPYASRDDVVRRLCEDRSLNCVVRPAVCIEAMRAGRLACLRSTHMSWLTLHSGSRSRLHRRAKEQLPGPPRTGYVQPTGGVRAEGLFVPLAPDQLHPLTA